MRNAVTLSPVSFFQLLKATGAPPSYVEILMNNNGVYNSYTVDGLDNVPTDYCEQNTIKSMKVFTKRKLQISSSSFPLAPLLMGLSCFIISSVQARQPLLRK